MVILLWLFFFFEKVTTMKSSTVINVLYTGPEGTETELDLASHFGLEKIIKGKLHFSALGCWNIFGTDPACAQAVSFNFQFRFVRQTQDSYRLLWIITASMNGLALTDISKTQELDGIFLQEWTWLLRDFNL
jgi:hypothetical protein